MSTGYVFCPRCATELVARTFGTQVRPACPSCGFVHFADPKVAVIALISCADQVLLTLRGVEPERGKWSLPGGYMDAGEMPEGALRREMHEEMQLALGALSFHSFLPMNGGRGIVIVYQAAPASGRCEPLQGYDDVAEARWFARDSLPNHEQLAFDTTISLLAVWQASIPTV